MPKSNDTEDMEFQDVEYLDDSTLEISIIEAEAAKSFEFDETAVGHEVEACLTTFLELDDSYDDDRTIQTAYSCPVCSEKFRGKDAIKKHVKRYFKFVCSNCEKQYFKERYLERHLKNAHLGSKQLTCPVCAKEFRAVNNLKQHLYLHSDEKRFACEYCDKRFKQKPGLQQHLRRYHKDEVKRECPYCHALVERLNFHIKTLHKEDVKKLIEEGPALEENSDKEETWIE